MKTRDGFKLQLLHAFQPGKNEKPLKVLYFKNAETVYRQGSPLKGVYFIKSGKIKCLHTSHNGIKSIVFIKGENDFLGFKGALLGRKSYSNTVEAWEDMELVFIPRKKFMEVINSNPMVLWAFTQMLCEDLLKTEEQMVAFRQKRVKGTVAHVLLWMSEYFKDGIPLSRKELANMMGIAQETGIRTLTAFKRRKLISLSHRRINILDRKGLLKQSVHK